MLYEYRCQNGHVFERVLPVADYKTSQQCDCGAEGSRILSLPTLIVPQDICYDSPVTGEPITSMKKRREDLARHGCRPYDPEMKTDYVRNIEDGEKRLDRELDATVEAEIEKMPARKKERLEQELRGGANPEVVRGTANQEGAL